ncbi:MAG: type III pantothenate kinase, partial [Pedobacter sp.]
NLQIIITGGDADFLNKQLKNSIFASQIIQEPYLVLKGLNEVITL